MSSLHAELKINRRHLLLGMSALATAAGVLQNQSLAEASYRSDVVSNFMFVSKILVTHELNPLVGHRIYSALSDAEEQFDHTILAIQDIIIKNPLADVEHLMPILTDMKLQNSALKIISAWYSGVVYGKYGDHVITFEDALMYKVSNDVMTIPSYAKSAPNAWNATAVPLLNMPSF